MRVEAMGANFVTMGMGFEAAGGGARYTQAESEAAEIWFQMAGTAFEIKRGWRDLFRGFLR